MKKNLHTSFVAIFALLWLAACSTSPPVPADRFYRLPEPQVNAEGSAPTTKIRVGSFLAQGVYNERAILYIDEQYPLMVRRYHYHFWINSPADLVRDQLIAYLRKTETEKKITPEIEISGRVLRFERIISPQQIKVIAELEVTTRATTPGAKDVTRVYRAEVPATSDKMNDTAVAFGKALDEIFGKVVSDTGRKG